MNKHKNPIALIYSITSFPCAVFCFALYSLQGFVTSVGNRDRRIRLALQSSFAPVVHATLTSLLAVLMLSTSHFDFIVRHFFWLLLAVMLIGIVNGTFFFPILLSLIGPAAELVPLVHPDRISTPSPPTYRQKRAKALNNNRHSMNSSVSRSCYKPPSSHHNKQQVNIKDEPSLTTITEEPQSWKSSSSSMSIGGHMPDQYQQYQQHQQYQQYQQHQQNQQQQQHQHQHQQQPGIKTQNTTTAHLSELQSIVVQPEVIVETTQNGGDSNTTKVTATANIKVELVAPGRITRSYSHN